MSSTWIVYITTLTLGLSTALVAIGASCRIAEPAPFVQSEETREPVAGVEVRYIANEGVLISAGGKRVLIDGLHRKYRDAYAFLPDAEREKMETARPPFDSIDLILVSHSHGDHFHPESVGRYLTSSSGTVLATSPQVADEVAAKFAGYAAVKDRVRPVTYLLKNRETVKVGGIDVEFLGVGHGSERHASIQNLGHVFTIGGKTFLHIGDAEPSADIFDSFDLEKRGIDVALLPAWFLTGEAGRAIIRDHIKPKHMIALHVGPAEAETVKSQVAKEFPQADVFTIMLEKRSF